MFCCSASTASTVKLYVVDDATDAAVPINIPVVEFNVAPTGSAPAVTVYVIGLSLTAVNCALINDVSYNVPSVPAAVDQAGTPEYSMLEIEVAIPPSVLMTDNEYVPVALAGLVKEIVLLFTTDDTDTGTPATFTIAPVPNPEPVRMISCPPVGFAAVSSPGYVIEVIFGTDNAAITASDKFEISIFV